MRIIHLRNAERNNEINSTKKSLTIKNSFRKTFKHFGSVKKAKKNM